MGESVNGRDGSVGGLVCYQRSSVNIAFRRARTNQGGNHRVRLIEPLYGFVVLAKGISDGLLPPTHPPVR